MIKKWAADAANQGVALLASLLMRSAIKPLLKLDERSLFAVGLSRTDVVECLATPLTIDPTQWIPAAKKCARAEVTARAGVPARG